MVVMAVAEHHVADLGQIDAQLRRVVDQGVVLAGVEQQAVGSGIDVETQAVLMNQRLMLARGILNQGGDVQHGFSVVFRPTSG